MRVCSKCGMGNMESRKTLSHKPGIKRTMRACNECEHRLETLQFDVDPQLSSGFAEFKAALNKARIVRIVVVDEEGRMHRADVDAGDVMFRPSSNGNGQGAVLG